MGGEPGSGCGGPEQQQTYSELNSQSNRDRRIEIHPDEYSRSIYDQCPNTQGLNSAHSR